MFRKLLLAISFILFIHEMVLAQESDSIVSQTESADSTELNFWKRHDVKLAAMPIVNYDPALGWNMAVMVNPFFRVSPTDTISPLSMLGAIVGYTTNKSWYWALYTRLYLDRDNWRISLAYGDASINFQHYDQTYGYIDFNSLNDLFMTEVQRRVYKRWYVGLRYINRKTSTTFEGQPSPDKVNMSNIGFVVAQDSRDFIYNPHTGIYFNIKTAHYRDAWGSDYKFDNYDIDFNKFFPLGEGKTLAARTAASIATGDSIPFEGQNVVGRDDIRGYTDGKHRANQTYNIQAEYRWNFYKKWGAVFFGGVATAVDEINQVTWSGLLPAVGVGGRFMAIPSEKINVGIDVAFGKDDWGIYFRIGETFGDK